MSALLTLPFSLVSSRTSSAAWLPLICLSLLTVTGCGSGNDGPERYSVSGTVTRDGEPMSTGTIEFHSTTDVAGNAMAHIVDGKFHIDSDRGPTAGTYEVRISSITPQATPSDPNEAMAAANEPPPEEEIAARFNTETELSAEVGPDQDNTFEFEVESAR